MYIVRFRGSEGITNCIRQVGLHQMPFSLDFFIQLNNQYYKESFGLETGL